MKSKFKVYEYDWTYGEMINMGCVGTFDTYEEALEIAREVALGWCDDKSMLEVDCEIGWTYLYTDCEYGTLIKEVLPKRAK